MCPEAKDGSRKHPKKCAVRKGLKQNASTYSLYQYINFCPNGISAMAL